MGLSDGWRWFLGHTNRGGWTRRPEVAMQRIWLEHGLSIGPHGAEEEEEIVRLESSCGGCDVFFFCDKQSTVAKAGWRTRSEPEQGGGGGSGSAQFWDRDPGWLWPDAAESRVSENRTGASLKATTTFTRILL